ncbi:MAG TPA: hypothetical protein VJR27_01260 [Candidatus Saccharimonadales bacterium]|nr:hypothetical protein [Candidatus Saccharimonadales bacterium]
MYIIKAGERFPGPEISNIPKYYISDHDHTGERSSAAGLIQSATIGAIAMSDVALKHGSDLHELVRATKDGLIKVPPALGVTVEKVLGANYEDHLQMRMEALSQRKARTQDLSPPFNYELRRLESSQSAPKFYNDQGFALGPYPNEEHYFYYGEVATMKGVLTSAQKDYAEEQKLPYVDAYLQMDTSPSKEPVVIGEVPVLGVGGSYDEFVPKVILHGDNPKDWVHL